MGGAFLIVLSRPYLERSLAMTEPERPGNWLLQSRRRRPVHGPSRSLPAARISDRVGRKTVIYGACAAGRDRDGDRARSRRSSRLVFVGAILVGVGGGSFLAVDWALMTDIIPKASSGRYMGLSNVATASNGVVAGVHRRDHRRPARRPAGTRPWARGWRSSWRRIWFAVGALLLRPVDERRREDDVAPAEVAFGARRPADARAGRSTQAPAGRTFARRFADPGRQVAGRRKSSGSALR